jgi:hypothetical protein
MLAAEAYTRDLPRAFVSYDALLSDWRAQAARIEIAHGAPLPKLTPAAGKKIDRFLTPDLRHNADDRGLERLGWAGEIAGLTHDWFMEAAADRDPGPAALAEAAARLAARQSEIGVLVSPAARDLATARVELAEARARLEVAVRFEAELRSEIARLEDGWRASQQALDTVEAELDQALWTP